MSINISNNDSKTDENYEPQRTLNMIMASQAMSSLKIVWKLVEFSEGMNTFSFKAVVKLKDFVKKQPKIQK
jgi:hypothetical protein